MKFWLNNSRWGDMEYHLGGYVVSLLKRLPRPGDTTSIGPFDVIVESVSRHRANKLRFIKRDEKDAKKGDETS